MDRKLGRERIYNNIFGTDKTVVHWDVINIKSRQEFIFRFLSTNSKYRQGVRLAIDVGDGEIEINNVKAREMYLWEDTAPKEVYVKCRASENVLSVYNVFDLGSLRGGKRSLTDSSGMIIEYSDNKITYHCNDAGFQDDFNKLIFQIELQ